MEFGLWAHCAEDAPVAWGARAIVEGNYDYDPSCLYTKAGTRRKRPPKNAEHKMFRHSISLLWDRQSWRGEEEDRKAFGDKISAGIIAACLRQAKELLRDGKMSTRKEELFELYNQDGVRILGNTNGSAGYLYLIAFEIKGE